MAHDAAAQQAEPEESVQQILMLQSYHRGNLTLDGLSNSFRLDVEQRAGRPLNIEQIAVGRGGSAGPSEQRILDYIRSIYAGQAPPDLIVAIAGPASVFARKYRQQLFPDVPLLFAGADVRFLGDAPLRENETAVAAINDYPRLVDDILQVLPETRQVLVVTGSGPIGQFWNPQLVKEFKRFEGRLTFIRSSDLTVPEILRRCASLPSHSAIIYITMGSDAQGGALPGRTGSGQPSRDRECAGLCGAEHRVWPRNRRRLDDTNRRPQPKYGRRSHSYPERRTSQPGQSAATGAGCTSLRLA